MNEFAKRDFLEQVLRHANRVLPISSSSVPDDQASVRTKTSSVADALHSFQGNKDWRLNIVKKGDTDGIVELFSTSTTLVPLPPKVSAPILCISSVSSLDHAIDLLANDTDEPLLAAYHYAAPGHAKYLAQFIKAEATFVNNIPQALLLGPAAPLFWHVNVEKRYTKEQFVRPAPGYIARSKSRVTLSTQEANGLLQQAVKEIREKKSPEWIALGFFEQGILLGLGVFGVPLLACLGASIFFGAKAGLRKISMSQSM